MSARGKFTREDIPGWPGRWVLTASPDRFEVRKLGAGQYRVMVDGGETVLVAMDDLEPALELAVAIHRDGVEVWRAQQAYEAARGKHAAASRAEQVAREVMDRAKAEVGRAQERRNLAELREQAATGALDVPTADKRLRELAAFDLGDRIWRLPKFVTRSDENGYTGLGVAATVTGLTWRMAGACLTFVTDDGVPGGEYHPTRLADARAWFWVTDGTGQNLVTGGHAERDRMESLAYGQTIADGELRIVRQGAEFIPAS